jgi:succinoglycan biosynthesis transport protein ExoP
VQQGSEGFDLERALGVLRRRVPLIALCVVVVAGAAFGFSRHQTKKYTASVSLDFNTNALSQQIAGLSIGPAGNSSTLLAEEASNVELVKSGNTAAQTAQLIGHGITEGRVIGSLTVEGQGESSIVIVSATTTSPVLSAKLVNTYAQQFVKNRQSSNLKYFKSALAIVHRQLAALSPVQRIGPDGLELQNRAQTLSLLSELKVGNVTVASEALPPSSPSSPKTTRNTALGLVIGLLIGLALTFLLERFDRRIRGPEDLEAIYRLPLLGAIPQNASLSRPARGKDGKRALLPAAEAERFSLIRARLRFFNIDRDLRTVLIASAEPGDGKTMVARHLAEAAARSSSRVLLIEVDLRHPTLAQQLSIPPGPGLADVLIGASTLAEAIRQVELDGGPEQATKGHALHVLTAGAVLPPNPGELLESQTADGVFSQARFEYDFVVIDTPPLTAVSDAFALLTKVDGIIVVGRIGRSGRNAARRLHQVLASSGAPLLGVIANGSKSSDSSVYAYTSDTPAVPPAEALNGTSPSDRLTPTA